MRQNIVSVAVMAILALSSCGGLQQPDQPDQPVQASSQRTVHVTLDVSLAETKALTADENGITPGFAEGDVIYVFSKQMVSLYVFYNQYLGTLTNSKDNLSRFSGDLDVAYNETGDYQVGLYYNQRDVNDLKTDDKPDVNKMTLSVSEYGAQTKGTLEEIAKDFDIAKVETTIHCEVSTSGCALSFKGPVTLAADQAILKTVFKSAETGESITDITNLKLFYGFYYNTSKSKVEKKIETTLSDGTARDAFFVALPSSAEDYRHLLTFIATRSDGKQFWGYKLLSSGLLAGKSYRSTVAMEKYDVKEPVDLGLSVNWYNINETAKSEIVATYDAYSNTDFQHMQLWETDETKRADWPTNAHYEELMNTSNVSHEWIAINGCYGYVHKSKKAGYTDRFIFFPASDKIPNRGLEGQEFTPNNGVSGFYWTATNVRPELDPQYGFGYEFYFMSPKLGDEATFDPGFYQLQSGSVNYAASLRKIAAKPGY